MRIQGRILRPSTLEERRLLLSLGLDKLRVSRGTNPFALVRKIQKVARGSQREMLAIRALACLPMRQVPAPKAPMLSTKRTEVLPKRDATAAVLARRCCGRFGGAGKMMNEEAATSASAAPLPREVISMLIIENQAHFDEVIAFAKKSGKYEPAAAEEARTSYLKNRLDYLESYGGKGAAGESRMRVRLFKDFAPYSFGFVIEERGADNQYQHVLTGGLLFHGAVDGYGSGSGPTFSVTLTPVDGWQIHT